MLLVDARGMILGRGHGSIHVRRIREMILPMLLFPARDAFEWLP